MSTTVKDRIYATKQDKVEDFVFDEKVASVFEDMIQRSVPGYKAVNQLLSVVTSEFITANSNVYDLGCSLGEASLYIANSNQKENVEIYAVDSSQAMIDRLEEKISVLDPKLVIIPVKADVLEVEINNASFIVLNYTLQFIEHTQRDDFIKKIYLGLNKNGALLLSEKIAYDNEEEDKLMRQLHENYKREQEYSELEISQKREALENVLIRNTNDQHIKRLRGSGFSQVSILTKYLNFVTYLAVK